MPRFWCKYRFNITTSKSQDLARFITLQIVPDTEHRWEEVTSGSQALSYTHHARLTIFEN